MLNAFFRLVETLKNLILNNISNVELVKMDVLDENNLSTFFKKIGKYDVLINAATGGGKSYRSFYEYGS